MKAPHIILFVLIAGFWASAVFSPNLDSRQLALDGLLRTAMNGLFVLALVPPLRAGLGINFGLPVGFLAGLAGMVTAMELRYRGFGSAGWTEFGMAAAIGIALAIAAGYLYALLLERVPGQELMVGYYTGLGGVAAMSIIWLTAPFRAPELIYPLGGSGLKQTILLEGHFEKILDRCWLGAPVPGGTAGPQAPYGLLAAWLLSAAALALFLRTRAGTALGMAGSNPRFAHLAGVEVRRMKRLSVVLSTAIAAAGIIAFSQSLGLAQLYKAPLGNTLPAVAAVLIGGASLKRASIPHALVGVALFQLLLVISPPVFNDLVQRYAAGRDGLRSLENLPEILRILILNGFILYALTRGGKEEPW